MPTQRIVPHIEAYDYTIHFLDGAVVLPDWQMALLPRGTKYVDMRHADWVAKVANESFVATAVKTHIGNLLELHFQR